MNENQNSDPFKLTDDQRERLRRNTALSQASRRHLGGLAAAHERHLAQLDALTTQPTQTIEEYLQEDLARRQRNDTETR